MQESDLQSYLQNVFSMPFTVHKEQHNGFDVFASSPENEDQSLFEVRAYIQNDVRIVVEIQPQKYAKPMLQEMRTASNEKKNVFKKYWENLLEKKVKSSLKINGRETNGKIDDLSTESWQDLHCRLTKVPITENNEIFSETSVICEWTKHAFCLFFSLLTITENISEEEGYEEGNLYQVVCNKYERNPINREICLAKKGYACCICSFDFEKIYGEIGKKFIHVHHIVPVSQIGPNYLINPEVDLIPICPNCHAMLHRKNPPYLPDELKDMKK